ncbi:MAG: hypothetical protein ACHQNT_06960 [Bacteroidia bacterium]
METIFKTFLIIHIACGFTAFIAAPVAMIVKKGADAHRKSGKLFFWCMTGVCISAFIMSVIHPNMFLFAISGFSYYMVVSGYRWIYRKKIKSVKDVAKIDWLILALAAVFNFFLLGYGIFAIVTNPQSPFAYIATVFGLIGVNFVRVDLKHFYKPSEDKNAWLLHHIGSMIGGYIATVSAFSAVNFNFLPTIIQWLWPTIIGVPLLIMWINFYKRKFKSGKKAEELVEVRM